MGSNTPDALNYDGDDINKMKRHLKLMYLRDLEKINKKTINLANWPSLSTINDEPPGLWNSSSNIDIDSASAVVPCSYNPGNVAKYLNAHINEGPKYTSSVKSLSLNSGEQTPKNNVKLTDEALAMPPPSSTHVRKNPAAVAIKNNNHQYLRNPVIDNTIKSADEVDEMSASDIFKSANGSKSLMKDSTKRSHSFSKWTLMITDDGYLLIKGKIASGQTARSKPIGQRITFTKLKSISGADYYLEGNLVDPKQELPKYVRDKFVNGFPDDWQYVCRFWYQYIKDPNKANFRWPTRLSDSDDDFVNTKDPEYEYLVSDQVSDKMSSSESPKTNKSEKATPVHKDVCSKVNDSNSNKDKDTTSASVNNSNLFEYHYKGLLQLILNEDRIKDCTREYITKVSNLLNDLNYFISYYESQNNSMQKENSKLPLKNCDDDLSIVTDIRTITPQKKSSSPLKNSSPLKKSSPLKTKNEINDEDSYFGVPRIPPNLLEQNMDQAKSNPRRSIRSYRRRSKPNAFDFNYDSSVSILSDCSVILHKMKENSNAKQSTNFKNNKCIDKDSGCFSTNSVRKKKQYSEMYKCNDETSDVSEIEPTFPPKKLFKKETVQKPVVREIRNVNVNLSRFQKASNFVNGSANFMELAKNKTEEKESVLGDGTVSKSENKYHEDRMEKKTSIDDLSTKAATTAENKSQVYGTIDNPKLLKAWTLSLVYDQRLENNYGLVYQGTLLNEAGHVFSKKYQTDPIVQRVGNKTVKTINNEYIKLEGYLTNTNNIPPELVVECLKKCPANITTFCKRWKTYTDIKKNETETNRSTENLNDSVMSTRKRRSMTESAKYLEACGTDNATEEPTNDNKTSARESKSSKIIAKKLSFDETYDVPKIKTPDQSNRKLRNTPSKIKKDETENRNNKAIKTRGVKVKYSSIKDTSHGELSDDLTSVC